MNDYTVEVTAPLHIFSALVKTRAGHHAIAAMQACEELFEDITDLAPDDDEYEVERAMFGDDCKVRVWLGHFDEAPACPSIDDESDIHSSKSDS